MGLVCDTFVLSGVPPRPDRVPSLRIFHGLGDGSSSLEGAVIFKLRCDMMVLFCSFIVWAISWMVLRRDVNSCRMVTISTEWSS